jgi:RNA polymerase sigma-70 factor, ECF subfamily
MTTTPALGPGLDREAALVDRARRGDQEAFTALLRHHDPGLRSLAFRVLGDRERMDDALQEGYVRAFRALPRFRGEARFGTWLYRIVYNACLNELARSRRLAAVPLEEGDLASDPVSELSRRRDLAEALAALAPEDRAAVLLVDAQGFDYREAASVLGVPTGTVASRLHRARKALRLALGEGAAG